MGLSAIVAIASIVSCLVGLHRKGKKAAITGILSNVVSYVNEAEQAFGAGNGHAKLQWVLTKTQIDCVRANVEIAESDIKAKVEEVLSTPQKKANQSTQDLTRTDIKE